MPQFVGHVESTSTSEKQRPAAWCSNASRTSFFVLSAPFASWTVPRAMKAALQRRDADAEDLRRLLGGEPLDVAEREHLAMLLRQRVERALDQAEAFDRSSARLGARGRIDVGVVDRVVGSRGETASPAMAGAVKRATRRS